MKKDIKLFLRIEEDLNNVIEEKARQEEKTKSSLIREILEIVLFPLIAEDLNNVIEEKARQEEKTKSSLIREILEIVLFPLIAERELKKIVNEEEENGIEDFLEKMKLVYKMSKKLEEVSSLFSQITKNNDIVMEKMQKTISEQKFQIKFNVKEGKE